MADTCLPSDALLLRLYATGPDVDALAHRVLTAAASAGLGCRMGRRADAPEAGLAYCYLPLPRRIAVPASAIEQLQACAGGPASVSRLALMQQLAGASHGAEAAFHYVVEMTPEPGFEVELQAWYDTEHLPGLAQVAGCVQAQRWWNHDAGPQSLACYDLVSAQTLGSPPWLAVRNTAWSARMRPRFMGTQRTMFGAGR